jgi:hypothetical protein
MNTITETEKWLCPLLLDLFGHTHLHDSSCKLIAGFQYNKGYYNQIQSDKVNRLTSTFLASPLPQ